MHNLITKNDQPVLITWNFHTLGGSLADMYIKLVSNETAISYGGADLCQNNVIKYN